MAKFSTKYLPVSRVPKVTVVGCGGTGSILAEHLARMISGYRLEVEIELIDGDVVEEANIYRQNFRFDDIGQNKAEALALRLSAQFGLEISARGGFLERNMLFSTDLTISCTDTLHSRRIVDSCLGGSWGGLWLDLGNEENHGQAVIGNTRDKADLRRSFWRWGHNPCEANLPTIAALNPRILKARTTKSKASCANMPFEQQGFGVNAMAALAGSKIAKEVLVDGQVRTAAIYFNVADGKMIPRRITRDLYRPWKSKGSK